MSSPFERRAITVVRDIDSLRTGIGPELPQYVLPLDLGYVLRWTPGSLLLDDGRAVINASGGTPGAYLKVRDDDSGVNLTNTTPQTITIGGGSWYVIPAGTLMQNVVLVLDTTNAANGDRIDITRFDVGAWTVNVGGLVTMPASARSFVRVQFSSGAWVSRDSHLML